MGESESIRTKFKVEADKPVTINKLVAPGTNARNAEKHFKYPFDWYIERERWFMNTQYKPVKDFNASMQARLSTAFCMGLLCGWQDRKRYVKELRDKRKGKQNERGSKAD